MNVITTYELPSETGAIREAMIRFHTGESEKFLQMAKHASTRRAEEAHRVEAGVHERMAGRWARTGFKEVDNGLPTEIEV